jgi:hypothetical protein
MTDMAKAKNKDKLFVLLGITLFTSIYILNSLIIVTAQIGLLPWIIQLPTTLIKMKMPRVQIMYIYWYSSHQVSQLVLCATPSKNSSRAEITIIDMYSLHNSTRRFLWLVCAEQILHEQVRRTNITNTGKNEEIRAPMKVSNRFH